MKPKVKLWLVFVVAIVLPNAGGLLSSLTQTGLNNEDENGQTWYDLIEKPSWNPPTWVFAPAWTMLYTAMGVASFLVYKEDGEGLRGKARIPLAVYAVHLVINWTWSPIFFAAQNLLWAFVHILILDVNIIAFTGLFYTVNKWTLVLLAPYIVWITFASALSGVIWQLNN